MSYSSDIVKRTREESFIKDVNKQITKYSCKHPLN